MDHEVRAVTVYLDCNSTTPVEERVAAEVTHHLVEEYGNAGSRTHEFGARAKDAVRRARAAVAAVVDANPDEVLFTSGATEANNLAILGLTADTTAGHLVTTAIEHKAVLEPMQLLASRGWELDVIRVGSGGWIDPAELAAALRPETQLVSVMHVNNETGIVQPLAEVADAIGDHPAFLHVDAAQGFGKELSGLRNLRVELISISGHKIYGPKGIGALVARRRGYRRPPLVPLMVGGGQERGLRPGTLPVPLIAGFGAAAELALSDHEKRTASNLEFRRRLLDALDALDPRVHGDSERVAPNTINLSIPGIDGEAAIVALKDVVAISNGSACTSQSYEPSHVLTAMGLPDDAVRGALRLSWCHLTEEPDWAQVVRRLRSIAT